MALQVACGGLGARPTWSLGPTPTPSPHSHPQRSPHWCPPSRIELVCVSYNATYEDLGYCIIAGRAEAGRGVFRKALREFSGCGLPARPAWQACCQEQSLIHCFNLVRAMPAQAISGSSYARATGGERSDAYQRCCLDDGFPDTGHSLLKTNHNIRCWTLQYRDRFYIIINDRTPIPPRELRPSVSRIAMERWTVT